MNWVVVGRLPRAMTRGDLDFKKILGLDRSREVQNLKTDQLGGHCQEFTLDKKHSLNQDGRW